ncbi:MAG: serpin family protein [Bacteroidales bacterium]
MKTILLFSTLFIATLLAFSCSKSEPTQNTNTSGIRQMRTAENALLASSNQFCFDYFALLSQQKPSENILFSPYSAHAALSMLIYGASGETKQEIKNALRISSQSDDSIKSCFKSLKDYLVQVDKGVTLNIANSVWAKQEFTVAPNLSAILKEYYQAEVNSLDFSNPQSVITINNWVNTQTNGKIPTIIDQISADAVMFIINAVYFKSDWKTKFNKNLTQKASFVKDDKSVISVDMMKSDKMEGNYFKNEDVELVDLPFGNGAYSFTILLPNATTTLDNFAATFNESKWANLLKAIPNSTTNLMLKMPRFEFAFETEMNENLKTLGMKRAFTDQAELPNLFTEKLPLTVSKVKQKTYIKIYEDGGEAAAVTSIEVGVTSIPVQPQYIEINRPFMCLIRERNSNTILFIGKVHTPEFSVN